MPNKFTQIQSTPYVPQYAPPNMGVMQQAGQNLWKRQEQGLQQYDALQESLNQLDVLEQDKELLQQKTEQINKQLSQFSDTNDFIEAQPAIRKAARDLQADVASGDLGIAATNKERALETFEKIENSDWSAQDKERMKNQYLSEYQGAQKSGRLASFTPPEYMDVEKEIEDRVKELEQVEKETVGLIKGEDGRYYKGKVTRKARQKEDIDSVVASALTENPKLVEVLKQKAKLQGENPEEYVIAKMKTYAAKMNERWGDESTGFSNIQWDENATDPTEVTAYNAVDVQSGSISTQNVVPDYDDYVSKAHNAKILGKESEFEVMKNGMASVLSSMVKKDEISADDFDYLMDRFGQEDSYRAGLTFPTSGWGQVFGTSGSSKQKDERLSQITDKVRKFVEKNEGLVSTNFPIRDGKQRDIAKDIVNSMTSTSLNLISNPTGEEMDESQKQDFLNKVIEKGTLVGLDVFSDESKPAWRFRVPVEIDGEEKIKTVLVEENVQPNIKGPDYITNLEALTQRAFPSNKHAKRIADIQRLHSAPVSGENIIDYLPPDYKVSDHIALAPTDNGGVQLELGEKETPLNQWDAYGASVRKLTQVKNDEHLTEDQALKQVNKELQHTLGIIGGLSTLTETEKSVIIDNINNFDNIPNDIKRKMLDEMSSKPITFKDKIEALNFAKKQKQLPER